MKQKISVNATTLVTGSSEALCLRQSADFIPLPEDDQVLSYRLPGKDADEKPHTVLVHRQVLQNSVRAFTNGLAKGEVISDKHKITIPVSIVPIDKSLQ